MQLDSASESELSDRDRGLVGTAWVVVGKGNYCARKYNKSAEKCRPAQIAALCDVADRILSWVISPVTNPDELT